jgi:hypothetical protein
MLALLAAGGAVGADTDSKFDLVPEGVLSDGIRKAATAYQEKRFEDAFGLFQRAACAGDKESQAALSHMYFNGEGVARDDLTGYAWLKVAAEVIYPPYLRLVGAFDKAMTPEQHSIADRLAEQMTTQYGRRETRMHCDVYVPKGSHIPDGVLCLPEHQDDVRVMLRKCVADAPQG